MIKFRTDLKNSIHSSIELAKNQKFEFINSDHLILAFLSNHCLDENKIIKKMAPDYVAKLAEIKKIKSLNTKEFQGEFNSITHTGLKRSFLYAKSLKESKIKPDHVIISFLEQGDGEFIKYLIEKGVTSGKYYFELETIRKKTMSFRMRSLLRL